MSQAISTQLPKLKSGNEPFHADGTRLEFNLLDWWRWDASDLINNTTRGRIAEFIVAMALGLDMKFIRDSWAEYDLEMPLGKKILKIEVKSKAYLQTWDQKGKVSQISFTVKKPKSASKRVADVYVLALLDERDREKLDPLNVNQWKFWAIPTKKLDDRKRSQHSIGLNSLKNEFGEAVSFKELYKAVVDNLK